jgi:hypothetical protein
VKIVATISTRSQSFTEATIVNLSEGGVGMRMSDERPGVSLSAGDEIHLRFSLPQGGQVLHTTGTVVWRTAQACGVRLSYIPDDERLALEQWLTACVERSLAELCERMRAVCA